MTAPAVPAGTSPWPRSRAWRRFSRNRAALLGLVLCLLMVGAALLAPGLAPHDPDFQFPEGLTLEGAPLPPGSVSGSDHFLLGTDLLGRDLFSRLVWGARASLTVGLVSNLVAVLLGLLIGALGALTRGALGTLIMRFTDVMLAFPVLLLAIALTAILRPSLWIVALVIAFLNWVPIARVVYSEVASLREREFVEAAQAVGASAGWVLIRHLPTALVWGSLGVGTSVLLEATLSFLGVGVQPPTPSWGGIINESQSYLTTAPWLVLAPGVAILLTSLGFNLLGEGLRDALDPRGGV